ncbi:hypothetical protein [Thermococcus piezophilus]|nr:hypothetical protein [Thermococcus piezophilus]
MKWALILHGGRNSDERVVFHAETADEARMMAVREMKKKDARVFELEKLE